MSATTSPSAGNGGTPVGAATQSCPCCSRLLIKELTFTDAHRVEKDTAGLFAQPEWSNGRAAQFPVAYTRNTKVSVTAKFTVSTPACKGSESVQITGTGTFGTATLTWNGATTVSPGATEVAVTMTSDKALPNNVDLFEASTISWSMNPCGCGWNKAGTTQNVVYVTLGNPLTTNYWTLLDVSCRGAKGETTEAGVIAKAFGPLKGRAITRKRDSGPLIYWKKPFPSCKATNTQLLLHDPDGSGQCGSWAEFFIDMCRVHGINGAHKIYIGRDVPYKTVAFLVKHWEFAHPPDSSATAFTHMVSDTKCWQAWPMGRLPAQRNDDSPPWFLNHFIVFADGKFWDPSYGAGPFANQQAWEHAAIDGLLDTSASKAGFDTSLNTGTNLLKFYDLADRKFI